MSLNKRIGFLLDNGFHPNFISSLNESKINILYEKMSKKETQEAQEIITKIKKFSASEVADAKSKGESLPGGKAVKMNPDGSVDVTMEGKDIDEDDTLNVVNDPDATADGMGIFEKFESKAQQGLFWARCNKCKSDDCKWCKMAKEFSKSTSKKQYKNMPEKKHPEKTVKYKKKETKEDVDYLKAVGSALTGGMKNNLVPNLINPKLKESLIRNEFENIIQKNLRPTMNKRDLLRLIEASMADTETETKPDVKPDVKPGQKPDKTQNPFKKPNPSPAEAIKKEIEKLQDKLDSLDDETKIEKLEDKIKELKTELKSLRKKEMGEGKSEFMSKVKEMGFLKK